MQTTTYLSFNSWLKAVDVAIVAKIGLSSGDLPDQTYYDWFEDEILPVDAANMAIESVMQDEGIFTSADVIYSYTRKQALDDGFQVDANLGDLAEVSRQHYKFPLYMTRHLFDLMETAVNNPKWCNDYKGIWHDILFMSIHAVQSRPSDDTVLFRVIINGAGNKKYYDLKAVCAAIDIDDPRPCVTFMLAEED